MNKIAEIINDKIATPTSILLHAIWFGGWFIFRLDMNTLTALVSLEAIFLTLFALLSIKGHHNTSKKTHARIIKLENQINGKDK